MTTPQKTIYDGLTGLTITRNFNDDELAQLELDKAQAEAQAKALAAKEVARKSVLAKLGLSAEEAAALFG